MAEGEVFHHGDVGAGGHLVVDVEVRAGRHDVAPARGMPLVDVPLDPGDQVVGEHLQRDFLRLPAGGDGVLEAE